MKKASFIVLVAVVLVSLAAVGLILGLFHKALGRAGPAPSPEGRRPCLGLIPEPRTRV